MNTLTDAEEQYLTAWERRHSVQLHMLHDPVTFVVKGVGDRYGLQVASRGSWVYDLFIGCPSWITLLLERLTPGVEIAAEHLAELWHDPTHGQIDRDIQQRVESDQIADGQRYPKATVVAIENSLQALRRTGRI